MKKEILLDGQDWFFKEEEKNEWLKAIVPGDVHLDLLRQKKIPEPFYGLNEQILQWIHKNNWVYQKKFIVDNDFLNSEKIELVFEGVDTFSDIFLNNKKIGKTESMFFEYRFDVKNILKEKENILELHFKSPTKIAKSLEKKYGELFSPFDTSCVYTRKAQYSFGWDWAPRFPAIGIYKSVKIVSFDIVNILSVFADIKSLTKKDAVVNVEYEIESLKQIESIFIIKLLLNNKVILKQTKPIKLKQGYNSGYIPVEIKKPELWYPAGYGKQPIYEIILTVGSIRKQIFDIKKEKFGLRTIKIIQEKDNEGKTFIFEINGIKIFCKGCDWIPSDCFISNITEEKYKKLLKFAKDGNMNMLRIWGGGIYESDIFYDLCDKYGLMIWHDFMFACGSYPEEKWFLDLIKKEFEYQIRRLRNHPSIVLWCGNNENEFLRWEKWAEKYRKNNKVSGDIIFYKILPHLLKKLDQTRPYWPSSPWGEEKEYNSQQTGDRHSWDVWNNVDYTKYSDDKGRFISEFGFQSMPDIKTIESFTKPEHRNPVSEIMENHNKQPDGTTRLFKHICFRYPVPENFKEFVFRTQILQAEALKYGIEHWRRRKFKTAGTLIWQLNDCWPVSSWSLVDYYLRKKLSYYYVKKVFEPVLVSIETKENEISIWLVNDLLQKVYGELTIQMKSLLDEKVYFEKKMNVEIKENHSQKIINITYKELGINHITEKLGPALTFVYSDDEVNGKYINVIFKTASNTYSNVCLIKPLKYLNLSKKEMRNIIHKFSNLIIGN